VQHLIGLNLSGNAIGQSSFFETSANALSNYFDVNKSLERLELCNNMLRGKHAEKVIKKISKCEKLTYLSLANNFLG
jgi:Ran GTPase-activating protein (RanGAP) involved in mRNA processing and transport